MSTQVDGLGPLETFDQGALYIHTPIPEMYSPASSKYPFCDMIEEFSARQAKELSPAPCTSPGQSTGHICCPPRTSPAESFLPFPETLGEKGAGDSTRQGLLEEPEEARPVILQPIC